MEFIYVDIITVKNLSFTMFRYFKDVSSFIVNGEQELEVTRNRVEHNVSKIVEKTDGVLLDVELNARTKLQAQLETIEKHQETISQLNKEIQEAIEHKTKLLITQYELEVKLEKEKQDLQSAKESLLGDEELRRLFEEAASLEHNIEERKENIRLEFNGFKKAVSLYETYLGCKIVHGEPGIILFDFAYYGAFKSKNSKPEFYVELQTLDEGKTWKLIGMSPDLQCREKLAKRLAETNDTQGLLAYVRKLYKPLMDKKTVANNENIHC